MDVESDAIQIHILLVEDNPADASLVRFALEEHQPERYVFKHVTRLCEAEELAAHHTFSVVLLDLNLPDVQGMETFARLSAIAPELPIIILTGLADQTLALQLVRMGAQDFLLKDEYDGRLMSRAIRYAIARKGIEKKLEEAAHCDSLTGLPNRLLFHDRLEQAILRIRRKGGILSLLFLDLDRFKEVNDTLGHAAGDELLSQLGQRFTSVLRKSDTVARMGGDEFTILLEDRPNDETVFLVASKLLALFDQPFCVAGQDAWVGTSIGIAISSGATLSSDAMLSRADSAMYHAKARGGNGYWVFRDSDDKCCADHRSAMVVVRGATAADVSDDVAERGDLDVGEILLVDDSQGDRRLIIEAFREARVRHRLHTFSNGDKAIACLRGNDAYRERPLPSLILLDLNMPGLSGLDLLRQIRALPPLKAIPVIIFSTSRSGEDAALAYDNGASAYVVKPLNFERLIRTVATLIDYWLEVVLPPPPSNG
jgi:diguanylate cyclase (GGDEF)-like protein